MSRLISRAEAWEKTYEAFSQINFTAFDYDTIKRSLTDYIRLYFPESFNDFIESSEFVAIIEAFAYIGEQLIYRVDVGSHENFMTAAQRKQSVLRLAKLISYKATRNIPARGLLKLTSVSTTETLYDSRGIALKGTTIKWNDLQNSSWKEQFTVILNAASSAPIGSVTPTERIQVDNVLFELYSLNNVYTNRGVLPYTANVTGSAYPMEVVPAKLDQYGPSERRPEIGSALTFLYGTDGFGSDSPTTGFFLFTKQGRLTSQQAVFDGKTPNQFLDLDNTNINDTDIWVNNVDPITGLITSNGDRSVARSGEWSEVDTTSAQNVVFSYTNGKNRFETETLENDGVRVVFGDAVFANIPNGTFDIWYRTSANQNLVIPQNAVVDQPFDIDYTDSLGNRQTLSITASLISNVQNASASEDIENIRRVAPAAYYSQNRMVSGADYNLFPLKDPSILKLRAINRTYAGESKFASWNDASETYENVKMAGTDLAMTFDNRILVKTTASTTTPDKVFLNYMAPALGSNEMFAFLNSLHYRNIRRAFSNNEVFAIKAALTAMVAPNTLWIIYNPVKDIFAVSVDVPSVYVMKVDRGTDQWTVSYNTTAITVESPTSFFWNVNDGAIISSDTLATTTDKITILKANISKNNTLLTDYMNLAASKLVLDETGLQSVTKLEVVAYDATSSIQQGIDIINQLIDPIYNVAADSTYVVGTSILPPPVVNGPNLVNPKTITLPFKYVKGIGEIAIVGLYAPTTDQFGGYTGGGWSEDPSATPGTLTNTIKVYADVVFPIQVVRNSFVYQSRVDAASPYLYITTTDDVRQIQANEEVSNVPLANRSYRRLRGVRDLNFMWLHSTPSYHLVDPSFTNINDVFIIQRGYYANYLSWLDDLSDEPVPPTPLQLRNDYKSLLDNAMLSDTVIFHPGKLRPIIGSKSIPELQATILVVKNANSTLTDSQIKLTVKQLTQDFFDVEFWEFGETFYFTELAAVIHKEMAADINSVVLVPATPSNYFGDLFQVNIQEDEIVQADIDVTDIQIVSALNATNLHQLR